LCKIKKGGKGERIRLKIGGVWGAWVCGRGWGCGVGVWGVGKKPKKSEEKNEL